MRVACFRLSHIRSLGHHTTMATMLVHSTRAVCAACAARLCALRPTTPCCVCCVDRTLMLIARSRFAQRGACHATTPCDLAVRLLAEIAWRTHGRTSCACMPAGCLVTGRARERAGCPCGPLRQRTVQRFGHACSGTCIAAPPSQHVYHRTGCACAAALGGSERTIRLVGVAHN